MTHLKEVKTKGQLKKFVKFPFKLYKGNSCWVPPIIKDEIALFDKTKNPVFKHANARLFLALENNEIVGRIAAIINRTEINNQGLKKMRFGWFDFIDNIEVSKQLLDKIEEIGRENKLKFMEGPVGFSNLDKVGVLTEGFDHLSTMVTWYNHPYYVNHFETLGFAVEKIYLENKFLFENVKREPLERISRLIKKRYQIRSLNFTKTKELLPYIDEMFDLFNESYASLTSFVPISNEEKSYLIDKYIQHINPEYIKFVLDKNGKMIAFAVIMLSYAQALQKANGSLFPFGFFNLLKAKKTSKDVVLNLIGIHPTYQKKGIHALLFLDLQNSCEQNGIKNCIRTPELIENVSIAAIWKNFNPITHKKRCTYKKNLSTIVERF